MIKKEKREESKSSYTVFDELGHFSAKTLNNQVLLLFRAVAEHLFEYEASVFRLGHFDDLVAQLLEHSVPVHVVAVLNETLDDSTRIVSKRHLVSFRLSQTMYSIPTLLIT